jgi:hypothetical protein
MTGRSFLLTRSSGATFKRATHDETAIVAPEHHFRIGASVCLNGIM